MPSLPTAIPDLLCPAPERAPFGAPGSESAPTRRSPAGLLSLSAVLSRPSQHPTSPAAGLCRLFPSYVCGDPRSPQGAPWPLFTGGVGVRATESPFGLGVAFPPVGPVPPPWSPALTVPGGLRVQDQPVSSQGLPQPFPPEMTLRGIRQSCAGESDHHTELTSHFPSTPTYWKEAAGTSTLPRLWKLLNKTSL